MKTVLLANKATNWPWLRQLPSSLDQLNFTTDVNSHWDYIVVYESLPSNIIIPKDKPVLFITGEPPSIKTYPSSFINQFDAIITCHKGFKHSNVLNSQQGLPWFIGAHIENPMTHQLLQNYSPSKPKFLSTVCSNKARTIGHKKRIAFTKQLNLKLDSTIDVFGRGNNPIIDKLEAISDYKFHLVIENERCDDYWTEKLADAFLGEAFPIYSGAPNILSYFPEKSLICFDHTSAKAIDELSQIILTGKINDLVDYNALIFAKKLILNEYNLFTIISRWILSNQAFSTGKDERVIKPEESFYNPLRKLKRSLNFSRTRIT